MKKNTIYVPVIPDRRRGGEDRYVNVEHVTITAQKSGTVTTLVAVLPDGMEVEVPLDYPIAVRKGDILSLDSERVKVYTDYVERERLINTAVSALDELRKHI